MTRHLHAARVADRDSFDAPRAVDQHTDAAAQRMACLGEFASQLMRDDVACWDAAAVDTLDAMLVGLREAQDVAVQLGNRELPLLRRERGTHIRPTM